MTCSAKDSTTVTLTGGELEALVEASYISLDSASQRSIGHLTDLVNGAVKLAESMVVEADACGDGFVDDRGLSSERIRHLMLRTGHSLELS